VENELTRQSRELADDIGSFPVAPKLGNAPRDKVFAIAETDSEDTNDILPALRLVAPISDPRLV
jgi:hypothetical protein